MKNKKNIFAITIIEEIKKNKKLPKMKTLSLEDILYKDETNKTLLEYMLENNISYYYGFIPGISSSYEAIKLLFKYNKISDISNISNKIYLTKENDKYFIEEMISSGKIDELHNLSFDFDIKLIEIFLKTNRKDLLSKIKISESELLNKINNETLLEYIIKENIFNEITIPKIEHSINILDILKKCNKINLIEKIPFSEELLLKNNQELLNNILNTKYYPNLKECSQKIIEYLYKINRPDILVNLFIHKDKLKYLFSLVSINENTIEYILKSKQENINYRKLALNIEYIDNKQDYIDAYLAFAKYDKLEYLYSFSSKDLLEVNGNERCLLEDFIKTNPNLTKKIIEYYGLDTDIDIILYFKLKGITLDTKEGIDFDLLDNNAYAKENMIKQNQKIKNSLDYTVYTEEEMTLLMELENLIVNEDNREIVDAIVISYALEIEKGNKNAVIELQKFIEIIKNNENFKIKKSTLHSYFNAKEGLNLNTININTINHELGHLFHYYLSNEETPKEFERVVSKIKQKENIKDRVGILSNMLLEQIKKLDENIEKEYEQWSKNYFTKEKIEEIKEFIQMSKEDKKESYENLGYTKEELELVLNESFTIEQYIISQKRIKIEEMSNNLLCSYYSELISICDIIDAIFEGDFYHSKLQTNDGEKIKGVFGHGIGYYYSSDICFQEILANYSSLMKSSRKEESLSILKSLVGEELIELLDNFYTQKIINSKMYSESYTL